MDIEIKRLTDIPVAKVIDAFQKAFCDYAVSFGRRQIESMLTRRGYCRSLSFAAFDGDEIVAFILNGRGVYDGKESCYDCGTGTLPSYRGSGLAGRLFKESLPVLRQAGIVDYILEVLTDNVPAIALYRNAGFEVMADYRCYRQEAGRLVFDRPLKLDNISIRHIGYENLDRMSGFCDFVPSWQNSLESIRRAQPELIAMAAFIDDKAVGYSVCDPETGDITQIAVDRPYRRKGVATALLSEAVKASATASVKVLNVDARCLSMDGFLRSVNFEAGLSQYAMRKRITDR